MVQKIYLLYKIEEVNFKKKEIFGIYGFVKAVKRNFVKMFLQQFEEELIYRRLSLWKILGKRFLEKKEGYVREKKI